MVLDKVSSPHRKSLNPFSSSSFKRQYLSRDEMGSWSALYQRHRFLLTTMILLLFLCTVYLYFAVTLGANATCSSLTGKEKALCRLEQAKASMANGKLKFF